MILATAGTTQIVNLKLIGECDGLEINFMWQFNDCVQFVAAGGKAKI